MEVRMDVSVVWCFLFFVTLFEVSPNYKTSVEGSSHAFAQGNNDMRYLTDGIPVTMHKDLSGVSVGRVPGLDEHSIYNSQSHLKFEPPLLDFKQRHLGIPHHEKVTLFNVNNNKTIHMSSISGNTVHFHSSFFEDKVIPPMGNTSFNVVFLGREEGEIESNLFIHTSEGSFKYQVKGASISSPYRIRPLVGIKIPVNATFSPLIYMHNPHETPLQITEVYSSGGEFNLELPSGELEGPKHLWEIPPFHTKAVIRIQFVGRIEKNHTAYVRIKVNKSEEVLVVPLDVEVTPHAGLYSPDDIIDFGIGGNRDEPKIVPLYLLNSGKKSIRIQSINTALPSKAIKIEYQTIRVLPDTRVPTKVAVLTFDWKAAFEGKDYNGKIVIRSKQSQNSVIIPYVSQILEGGLTFNASVTQYCLESIDSFSIRTFDLINLFEIPVAVTDVTLHKDACSFFKVHYFLPAVIPPVTSFGLFSFSLRRNHLPPDFKLETSLYIHTNVSLVTVPLLCYSGRLQKIIIPGDEEILDFGTVACNSQRESYFAVLNNNPVAVSIEEWGTNLSGGVVEFIGTEEGNKSTILKKHQFINMNKSLLLQPGHFAVFLVLLTTPDDESFEEAAVFVKTEFENVLIRAKLKIVHGSFMFQPYPIIFSECFPGKLCKQQLHLKSHFRETMKLTDIVSVPPDPRITYVPPEGGSPVEITDMFVHYLGELHFEPGLKCGGSKCYTGIPYNTSEGRQWLHSLALPFHCQDSDLSQLNYRYNQFSSLTKESNLRKNLTFRLDTTEVRGFVFHASVQLVWPRLVYVPPSKKPIVDFPLTQVGDTVFKDLTIHNPSSHPILVQLAMDWTYPQAVRMLDSLSPRFYPRIADSGEKTLKQFMLDENSENVAYIEKMFGINVHPDTLPFLLEPGEQFTTKIGFNPTKSSINSAVLFVRNNLTILEVLRVTGRATYAQFKFGNRKPGSPEPLMFELSKKHFRDCEREKHRKFPLPNLTVKRSFTARNTGELPIYVSGFRINGLPCEGYGFRILNCAAFHLQPNETRKIDIAFTPDFTLARVHRILGIDTSIGIAVNYTLIATIPPYFLATCASVLGRPYWEPLFYYTAIGFMIFLLICVLTAAYFESDRILKCTVVNIKQEKAQKTSLDARIPTTSAGSTGGVNAPGMHNCTDKSHFSKADSEWNLSNSTLGHSHEKNNKDMPISNHSHHCNSPKPSMWNSFEGKQLPSDIISKEHTESTKFEDIDAGYSTSTTPLLSMRHRKKLPKKNMNNSYIPSVSESLQEKSPEKKEWSNTYIRQNILPTLSGKSQLNLAEPKVPNNKATQEPEVLPKTKKNLEVVKESKKSSQVIKKCSKTTEEVMKCYEEETSSTTTESSNNEETEKERSTTGVTEKLQKTSPKKERSKTSYYKDNYEGDCDDDDYERENHKKKEHCSRWKTNLKVLSKTANELPKKGTGDDVSKRGTLETSYKPKPAKTTNRERKEKNILRRRAAAERNAQPKVVPSTTLSATPTSTTIGISPLSSPAVVTQSNVCQRTPQQLQPQPKLPSAQPKLPQPHPKLLQLPMKLPQMQQRHQQVQLTSVSPSSVTAPTSLSSSVSVTVISQVSATVTSTIHSPITAALLPPICTAVPPPICTTLTSQMSAIVLPPMSTKVPPPMSTSLHSPMSATIPPPMPATGPPPVPASVLPPMNATVLPPMNTTVLPPMSATLSTPVTASIPPPTPGLPPMPISVPPPTSPPISSPIPQSITPSASPQAPSPPSTPVSPSLSPPSSPPITQSVSTSSTTSSGTASCWTETRVSFSDVARNESPLYSNIVAPKKQNQAVGTTDAPSPDDRQISPPPRKTEVTGKRRSVSTSASALGPVGSKPHSSVWDGQTDFHTSQIQSEENTGMFLDSYTDQAQQSDDSLGGLPYTDSSWEQDNSVPTVFEDSTPKEAPPKSGAISESWPMMDALWKPLYTPPQPLASNDDSLFSDTPVVAKNKTEPSEPSYSPWGTSNPLCIGSVWSSSAWSTGPGPVAPPLTTPAPILSPIAPAQRKDCTATSAVEERPSTGDLDRGLGFDPFTSLNTIWFPRPPESWIQPRKN